MKFHPKRINTMASCDLTGFISCLVDFLITWIRFAYSSTASLIQLLHRVGDDTSFISIHFNLIQQDIQQQQLHFTWAFFITKMW